jgi:hypothetical protein
MCNISTNEEQLPESGSSGSRVGAGPEGALTYARSAAVRRPAAKPKRHRKFHPARQFTPPDPPRHPEDPGPAAVPLVDPDAISSIAVPEVQLPFQFPPLAVGSVDPPPVIPVKGRGRSGSVLWLYPRGFRRIRGMRSVIESWTAVTLICDVGKTTCDLSYGLDQNRTLRVQREFEDLLRTYIQADALSERRQTQ